MNSRQSMNQDIQTFRTRPPARHDGYDDESSLTARKFPLSYEALGILDSIERHVQRSELAFGRQNIQRFMSSVPGSLFDQHIADYRHIIRARDWPNEKRPTSIQTFIQEYVRAAAIYVDVAFDALAYLNGSSDVPLEFIFHRAEASEALRGQFGKRATFGIDARIEYCAEQTADALIDLFPEDDVEGLLVVIGTPNLPHQTAETRLLEDFHAYVKGSRAGTLYDDDAARSHDERTWRILRRHARWSANEFSSMLRQLDQDELNHQYDRCRHQQYDQIETRQELIRRIARFGDSCRAFDALKNADALIALNYLNLALEPSFSFKGAPGLLHLMTFEAGARRGLDVGSDADQIQRNKWTLFKSYNKEEHKQ